MTKHAKLSASGSSRWLNCPGSIKAEENYPNTSSTHADEGSLAHHLADTCLKNEQDAYDWLGMNLTLPSDDGNVGLTFTIEAEMVQNVQAYIDYVNSFKTGDCQIYYEEKVNFSNYVPAGFGTVDSALLDFETGILHIFDLKYGERIEVSAIENTQLQLYALGFYQELEFLDAIKSIKLHVVQPRMYNYSVWEISIEELLNFGDDVQKKALVALSENAPRIAGDKQCKYCKAKKECPALFNLTKKVLDISNQSISDNEAKFILDNKELIEDFMSSVKQNIFDKLANGDKFEGYKLVEDRAFRKWVDGADNVLIEKFGERAYKKSIIGITEAKKSLTKEEIDQLTYKPAGKVILVPSFDKRKEVGKIDVLDGFDVIEN